jgi:hypothetical protein
MDQNQTLENKTPIHPNQNDAGIWICECSGISISPCLLIQALCSDPYPQVISATWKGDGQPPKAFQKTGTIPLIYGQCNRPFNKAGTLHLFSIQTPVAVAFEQFSHLQDWSFPAQIQAIVALFDQRHDKSNSAFSLKSLFSKDTINMPVRNRTMEWIKTQHLPYIAAFADEDLKRQDETKFRQRYDLPASIPVLSGPSPRDERLKTASSGAALQFLFFGQKVGFVKEYAHHILEILDPLIEGKNE